ncbi:SPIN3-like protein [Mya arenaria]|uniref:SPIN3-like protein n=1 Tax=Mya arenaria TaxID=6604 RepID=A0ABY7DE67_MYAAR|nr:SPIN3-like protein [Mya arenaria]
MNTTVIFPKPKETTPVPKKSDNVVSLQQQVECLSNVAADVVQELNSSREENAKLEYKLKLSEQLSQVKVDIIGNVTKLKDRVHKYKDNERYMNRLRLKNVYSESCVKKNKLKFEQESQKNEALRNELKRTEYELNTYRIRFEELQKQLQDIEQENNYLRDVVNDNVVTYDEEKRKYTPQLQQCVYDLLNLNVSLKNVSPAIESVLNIVQIKPNRLPSKSTVNNMNIQRLALMMRQINSGKKIEGIHATDESGNYWVLGVREISLHQILGDIDALSESADKPVSREILKNISSTMSDRASTQMKFNQLLEEFRTDVLKEDLGEEWDNMSEEEQLSISKLCNFFCSLHTLVHMAETASKALIEYEVDTGREAPILDPTFKNSAEPGTVRLVRTACKAFSKGGDEKNGQYLTFQTYSKDFLRENGFRGVPLERFRGNRFNILFRNAAALFFLKDKLQSYLSIEHSNRLLASVHHDINIPEYVAGCKALGLISELVTVPLWCVIESENIHIIEAQTLYQELVKYLEELPQNIASFMNGTYLLSFANREKLQTSKISIALFNEWEYDGQVQIILMIIVPALCELCKRLFKDFLPEGLWFNAPGAVEDKTRSAPKHNKFSETIFGHMDRLLREKPNTSIIASEANLMFVHNKTNEWLRDKTEKEKEVILNKARKDVKHLRRAFKQRNAQIETERKRILAEKREKAEQAEQNRIKKREDITDNVQLWGLWQTEQEVDSSLSRIKRKTEQVSALKAQLNFRKSVFEQKCEDKSVYRMSKKVDNKNVPLSVEELTLNAKKLVRKAYEVDVVANPHEQVLVGRKINHAFMTDGERTWYIGKVISQVPGFPSWFNVKYSGDQAIYSYRLLDDLKSGELKLIV